jgi:hypothetical protein
VRAGKLLAAALLTAFACWGAEAPDCSLAPGWEQQGQVRTYVSENLFDYMDGNAEGYLIYGFVRMQGVTCKSGENSILVDVFEMKDPESAYGVFTANRDPRQPLVKLGMAAQIQPRRAILVKGKYYVEFAASPAGDHTAALRAFASAMEKRMEGQTALPEPVGWFPKEKLDQASIRLIPQSVLGIRQLKRGYVAVYEYGKAFIVTESSPESATSVMSQVKERIGQTEPVQVADGGFQAASRYLGRICVFRKGRYLAGLANVTEGADVVTLAKELAQQIP